MAWWDFGIAGKNGNGIVASGGVEYPVTGQASLVHYINVGSVALPLAAEQGQVFPSLSVTACSGTQVFIESTLMFYTDNDYVGLPTENVRSAQYGFRLRLHKNGTDLNVSNTFIGGYHSTVIAGTDSIYNYNYRKTFGNINTYGRAFPRAKEAGANVNQVAITTDASGIHFYVVGYPVKVIDPDTMEEVIIQNPCMPIGSIPTSVLTNPFWFDQDQDGLSEGDYYNEQAGTGGRPTDYEYEGDDVDFPDLPSGASAIGIGRMKLYHPTAAQLNTILDVIWTDPTPDPSWDVLDKLVENFTKWLYKPEKWLVSLMLMPINVSGTNAKVYLGKYDTLTTSPAISNQWQEVDCGSLQVPLKSGSAFDFAPYVKSMIYLPYVGFRPINANEIMGGTIYIKYYIDMFTGSGLCMIKIANENSNTSVLYSYECNIAQQIPITSDNYNQVINSLISASLSMASNNMGAAAANGANAISGLFSPDVQTSGIENPNTGALGSEVPYVVLHFPVQASPQGFVNQNGYPASTNMMLGALSGYTEVEKIHLHIPGATEEELRMIEDALKAGVIL